MTASAEEGTAKNTAVTAKDTAVTAKDTAATAKDTAVTAGRSVEPATVEAPKAAEIAAASEVAASAAGGIAESKDVKADISSDYTVVTAAQTADSVVERPEAIDREKDPEVPLGAAAVPATAGAATSSSSAADLAE